ncbi:MAG: hypothetical protein JNL50_14940 [Phycisphaerae bacterium]|nr:hypothetical protein [Phycisphaerae bacterium]
MHRKLNLVPRVAGVLVVCGSGLVVPYAAAQCVDPIWLPGDGVAGTNLYVRCSTLWDPDGSGPITPKVVIGGRFDVAGNANAANIAMWDPASGQWSALGVGLSGLVEVSALAALPNGRLVVGGAFTEIGGIPANAIATYDGTNWGTLGDGMQGSLLGGDAGVSALAVLPNGDLVAGGDFLVAGSVIANGMARWNGSAWSALGDGAGGDLGLPPVAALAVLPNGNIVAAGGFTEMGGSLRSNIARWDGSSWQDMAGGMDSAVNALAIAPNGNLVATGYFQTAGGVAASRVARWDSTTSSAGTAWSALGAGLQTYEDEFFGNAVAVMPNGDVIVAGNSYIRDYPPPHANGIARWNGTAWSTLAGGLRDVYDNGIAGFTLLKLQTGELLVGGQFNRAGGASGVGAANLATWNGSSWSALATGFNDWLITAEPLANGDVLACGAFTTAGAGPAPGAVARFNGSTWAAVGSPGLAGFVSDAIELGNGEYLVGGGFWLPGQDAAVDPQNGMAIFDGTSWTTSGVYTPNAYVYSMTLMPNGNIAVGGLFNEIDGVPLNNVAIYDINTTQWTSPGSGVGASGEGVIVLAARPNGDLVAGGFFSEAGGVPASNIARYNETEGWSAMGDGTDATVYALGVAPGGDVLAAGVFAAPSSGVARWNGTSWSGLGGGLDDGGAYALTVKPNGEVYLGGQFTSVGGVAASNIAKWNGASWSPLGEGVDGGFSDYSVIYGLNVAASGQLLVAGQFNRAGGQTSVNFARYGCEVCPADFNHDGFVNGNDYDDFAALFDEADPGADINHDGFVNGNDYDEFADHFDLGC